MKSKILNAIIISVGLLLAGCAPKLGLVVGDTDYRTSIKNSKIGIVSFHLGHQSDFGRSTGLIGALVDAADGAPVNPEAFNKMQTILKESNLFLYQDSTFDKTWKKEDSPEELKQFFQKNQFGAALQVSVQMMLIDNGLISGKFGAFADWKIIAPNGEEKIYIRTRVEDDEIFQQIWNPSTKEIKHKEKVLRVIERSAEDFIALLSNNQPKYGKYLKDN